MRLSYGVSARLARENSFPKIISAQSAASAVIVVGAFTQFTSPESQSIDLRLSKLAAGLAFNMEIF